MIFVLGSDTNRSIDAFQTPEVPCSAPLMNGYGLDFFNGSSWIFHHFLIV